MICHSLFHFMVNDLIFFRSDEDEIVLVILFGTHFQMFKKFDRSFHHPPL